MTQTVAQAIVNACIAKRNCLDSGNLEWYGRHGEKLARIERDALPSGSGFDAGSQIQRAECTRDKISIKTAFHHMNENGYYDGWSEHIVTVRATFSGFDITVSGRNRNGIKEYIADTFHAALSEQWEYEV